MNDAWNRFSTDTCYVTGQREIKGSQDGEVLDVINIFFILIAYHFCFIPVAFHREHLVTVWTARHHSYLVILVA